MDSSLEQLDLDRDRGRHELAQMGCADISLPRSDFSLGGFSLAQPSLVTGRCPLRKFSLSDQGRLIRNLSIEYRIDLE